MEASGKHAREYGAALTLPADSAGLTFFLFSALIMIVLMGGLVATSFL